MQLDEITEHSKDVHTNSQADVPKKIIEFHNVNAKWPVTSVEHEENTLTNISFQMMPGQFLSVVGQVGCGKVNTLKHKFKQEFYIFK